MVVLSKVRIVSFLIQGLFLLTVFLRITCLRFENRKSNLFDNFNNKKSCLIRSPQKHLHPKLYQISIQRGQKTLLHSSVIAPPPVVRRKQIGGGDEEGLRMLTSKQVMKVIQDWYLTMPKNGPAVEEMSAFYGQMMSMSSAINDPLQLQMGNRKYGKSRHRHIAFAMVKSKRIHSIALCELRTDTSINTGPPHFIVKTLALGPENFCNLELGIELIEELKRFCVDNAMVMELDLLLNYPHSRVLALEGSFGVQLDPSVFKEQNSPFHLVQRYKDQVKVPMVVVPEELISTGPELGSYWYEGEMPDGVKFFVRQRLVDRSEFDFLFDWPWIKASGTQLTGTGSVRNPTVVTITNIADYHDDKLKSKELHWKVEKLLEYFIQRFKLHDQESMDCN